MKIGKKEIMGTVKTFSAVAKLPGGDDLVHFSKDRITVRSHLIDIDRILPGVNFDCTVSAKNLANVLRDMATTDLTIQETKTLLKITDGVRKATLTKKDISDDRFLTMDFDAMESIPVNFWSILGLGSYDGTGNKGVQFLGTKAVNKTNAEFLIFDVESTPMYLTADQIDILLELGMGYDTRVKVTDTSIELSDITTQVFCKRGRVPSGVTLAAVEGFQKQLLEKGNVLFSEMIPDNAAVPLKHVANFGANDEERGTSVILSFDPTTQLVKLIGSNSAGSFEETLVDLEYSGGMEISVAISTAVIASLIGKSFTLVEDPKEKNHMYLVSENPDIKMFYIGQGKRK